MGLDVNCEGFADPPSEDSTYSQNTLQVVKLLE